MTGTRKISPFICLAMGIWLGAAPNRSSAQELYMPRDVKKAFAKGTRSMDGRPGEKYWQNTGRYDITVNAAPPDRNVSGKEKITYINNSPDTLRNVVIRLTLNIHRPGVIRYTQADSAYLTQGLQIDRFEENGQTRSWGGSTNDGTYKTVRLSRPLLPHDSIKLAFDWHYQISLESNREGMIDSTTYFLAYFYPRVAVFDDYVGWDRMDFTDQQEFYNDFNDYTLTVNVPANYIVWSTGDLQNPTEVLQPVYAARLAASYKTDSILHIATPADLAGKKVTAQKAVNSWIWKASNITDVTCALSDHFVWDASSVVVDDATRRRASVQSAYNDTARDFHQMVEFARHALDWLSHNWPGVPYPFPKTTVVQGYADMEYPMMVNDNTTEDPLFSRFVVEHEIAHTWFPFYMGINETRFGFMDEGWATTFELLIGTNDIGKDKAEDLYKQFRVMGYIGDPSSEEDLPIITPGNVLRGVAYGNNAYGKPSLAYLAVKDLLGDDQFRKCLHGYMDRWHGKHPIPWDFFNSFNNISGKDLNWFWHSWFFTNNYIDLAIDKGSMVKMKDGKSFCNLGIRNVGGFPIPFDVVITYTDGSEERKHYTPAIWQAQPKTATASVEIKADKQVKSARLDGGIYVDATPADNQWTQQ